MSLTDALRFVTSFLIETLPIFHVLLGLLLSGLTLAFLIRIILTWYPQVDSRKSIWILFYLPTEPILQLSRKAVAPIGGVDITPVIWVGVISLIRELLVGQQGILSQILIKTHT